MIHLALQTLPVEAADTVLVRVGSYIPVRLTNTVEGVYLSTKMDQHDLVPPNPSWIKMAQL